MINIFFWAALLLLAGLARYHYRYALALSIAAMPLYLMRTSIGGIPTNVFELGVIAVALGAASQPAWRQATVQASTLLPRPLRGLVLLWLLAAAISTAISSEFLVSVGILKGWILVPLLLGYLVYVAGPTISKMITKVLIFTGVAVAAIGLWQITDYRLLSTEYPRLASIYDVPNSLALWLVPLIVIAVWQRTITAMLAAIIMSVALLLTQSAAGIGSLLLTLSIGSALFLHGRERRIILGTTIIVAAFATAYLLQTGRLTYLASPWTTNTPNSISVRAQLWYIGADLVSDHPLLGIGLGQFEPAYQQKLHARFQQFENCSASWRMKIENCTRPLAEYVFRDPHNWLLTMWLNLGLLGLVVFIGIHGYAFWHFFHLQPTPYSLQPIFLALVSLLLFGLVDTIYWKNDLAALQVLLITLVILTVRQPEKDLSPRRQTVD